MNTTFQISELFIRNPFYLLELPTNATAQEVGRQGGKILGMLELDIEKGGTYQTPWGPQVRDASDVRQAMAELRDPARHQFYAFWVGDIYDGACFDGKQSCRETDVDFLAAAGF